MLIIVSVDDEALRQALNVCCALKRKSSEMHTLKEKTEFWMNTFTANIRTYIMELSEWHGNFFQEAKVNYRTCGKLSHQTRDSRAILWNNSANNKNQNSCV